MPLFFFSNQWIFDNLPHKDPRRNKVNVTIPNVTNEYKPVEMCKDVRLLDDNNNLQCVREDAVGDKDQYSESGGLFKILFV